MGGEQVPFSENKPLKASSKMPGFRRFYCVKNGSAEMSEVERKQMTNGAAWLDKHMDCIKDREKKSAGERLQKLTGDYLRS